MFISVISIHIITPLIKKYRRNIYRQLFDNNGFSPITLLFPYLWEEDINENTKIKIMKTIFKISSTTFIVSFILLLLFYVNKI